MCEAAPAWSKPVLQSLPKPWSRLLMRPFDVVDQRIHEGNHVSGVEFQAMEISAPAPCLVYDVRHDAVDLISVFRFCELVTVLLGKLAGRVLRLVWSGREEHPIHWV